MALREAREVPLVRLPSIVFSETGFFDKRPARPDGPAQPWGRITKKSNEHSISIQMSIVPLNDATRLDFPEQFPDVLEEQQAAQL
jgi:hypothetical protein